MILGAILLGQTSFAGENHPVCFHVGAGGGSKLTLTEMIPLMKERGIKWVPFTPGNVGTVVERAQIFTELLAEEMKDNADFKCHAFGYSMGGPVFRYAYHHLSVTVQGKKIPVKSIFKSLTTFSSPNYGTPLAGWLKRYAPEYSRGAEDLSEKNMHKFNSEEFPETYSPVPTEIPTFSYLTLVEKKEDAESFITRAGFQIIEKIYSDADLDPRNDGIVPLISQPFGKPLAAIKAEHGYFAHDLGLRPYAVDIYELQWNFLEGNLEEIEESSTMAATLESDLLEFTTSPLSALLD